MSHPQEEGLSIEIEISWFPEVERERTYEFNQFEDLKQPQVISFTIYRSYIQLIFLVKNNPPFYVIARRNELHDIERVLPRNPVGGRGCCVSSEEHRPGGRNF